MSFLVTLDTVAAKTPDGRPLFDNLSLAFGRELTGLVGKNGVGKTTLLRIVAGELQPAAGSVAVNGRVGVLRQAVAPPSGATAAEAMGVAEPLARLARLEAGEGSEDDIADADWTLPGRLGEALVGVGLGALDLARPAASLSGGETTRAALAGLMAAEPDLLILDEPTNNLDVEARAYVAGALAAWRGGAIVVSHDRGLLRRMDRIVELTGLGAAVYGGGYDLYLERKSAEEAAAQRDLAGAERTIDQTAREAQQARERKARRDAAGRKSAAKGGAPKIVLGAMKRRAEESTGRESRLAERLAAEAAERLAAAEAKVERTRRLAFDLPPSGLPAGRQVLILDDVGFAYPDGRQVLEHISLRVTGPQRVALTGPNGAGKSTLIRLILGELSPNSGRLTRAVPAVALDQRTAILKDEETLLDAYRRLNPGATPNQAHAALARFLFRNTAALKRVGELSGGERLRVGLACTLAGLAPPQLLILDEPTNHLDLDSIAAVEAALNGYDGALLVVSHDRDFLEAVEVEREIRLSRRP